MSDRVTLIDNVYLRYSGKGHVRFSLPAELTVSRAPEFIEKALYKQDGVYRVTLFRNALKLSIRYDDTVCSYKDLCLRLKETIEFLPDEAFKEEAPPPPPAIPAKAGSVAAVWREFRKDRLSPLKGEFIGKMLHMLSGNPLINERLNGLQDKAMDLMNEKLENIETQAIHVLNEIVLFYLIKLHWDVITNILIKAPFRNINKWLAIFYLIYLYVRFKR